MRIRASFAARYFHMGQEFTLVKKNNEAQCFHSLGISDNNFGKA